MARSVAFDLVEAVLHRKRPLDVAIEDHRGLALLSDRDRAFARNLVATTLRRLGQIDALVDHCLKKPLPWKARPVRTLLRLGVCQLMFLETPAHAALDTTVSLARALGHDFHASLINAVLRRLVREGKDLRDAQDAARLNTPDWLWEAWSAAYGAARCREIAAAHLDDPPLDLFPRGDAALWAGRLGATVLATGSLRCRPAGPVTRLPGYDEGAWWVQDAAAALPARLLGDVAGRHVVDLCAAPGGKTAQLAAAGARVTAVDRSQRRLERLSANLARLGLDAVVVRADAVEWRPPEPVDAVLLDAPCTTTGTIRRHPDIARLKTPADVEKLAALQGHLLRAALDMVKPGGTVVYATCSLQPEEGPAVVEALLSAVPEIVPVPVDPGEIGGDASMVNAGGDLRTLPCHLAGEGGIDGFFAARLCRRTTP